MIFKLRQRLHTPKFTRGNRLPNLRSRKFIINYLRNLIGRETWLNIRAGIGITYWIVNASRKDEARIAYRAQCFITGRSRGTTQRFSVARTKIKALAAELMLPGVRKGSW